MGQVEQIGSFRVETVTYRMCLGCLVESGDEFGTTVNREDGRILIQNVQVVPEAECETHEG